MPSAPTELPLNGSFQTGSPTAHWRQPIPRQYRRQPILPKCHCQAIFIQFCSCYIVWSEIWCNNRILDLAVRQPYFSDLKKSRHRMELRMNATQSILHSLFFVSYHVFEIYLLLCFFTIFTNNTPVSNTRFISSVLSFQ